MDLSKATKGRRMSKKTHKKASKPKAGTKAKASAKKTPDTISGARTKGKTRSPTAGARKAATAKAASKTAPRAAKASSRAKQPAKKTVTKAPVGAKAPAAAKSRATIHRTAKPSSTEPARGNAAAHAIPGLSVGSKVPTFQLPRDGGTTVSLDSFAGRKLVLFFYPRASTPGCTKEAMDFSRLSDAFAAVDTDVAGISADPLQAQEAFRERHDLTIPLLSDETHAVLKIFGVWGDKSLYGRVFQGIIRTTVLIGPDARVINVWRNVKVDGHAEAVLNYIENL
jgi:peroxiredoxin Q/BCP